MPKKTTIQDVLRLKPGEGLVVEKPEIEIVLKNEFRKAKLARGRKV